MRIPNKMRGNSLIATEWNKLIDYLRSVKPIPAQGTPTDVTTRGTVRRAARAQRSGGGTAEDNLTWL